MHVWVFCLKISWLNNLIMWAKNNLILLFVQFVAWARWPQSCKQTANNRTGLINCSNHSLLYTILLKIQQPAFLCMIKFWFQDKHTSSNFFPISHQTSKLKRIFLSSMYLSGLLIGVWGVILNSVWNSMNNLSFKSQNTVHFW